MKARKERSGRAAGLRVILALVLAAGGGCTQIKNARLAQDASRAPAGERTVTAAEAGLSAGTELTAERAVELALQYHPQMVVAQENLAIARSRAQDAVSGYLPTVRSQAQYERTTQNSSAPGAPSPSNDSEDSYSAGVNLDQLLLDFGRTSALVRQAGANKLAAEQNLRSAANDVTFLVRQAYYDLSKAQALLVVARDTEKEFEAHLEQTRALVEVGRRIRYDLTKAEVDLGNARLNVISAENAVKTSRAALAQAMGLAEDPGFIVTEPAVTEYSVAFDALMDEARSHNPSLLALMEQERAASAGVDYSIADLAPKLTLGAGYTWNGSDFPLTWNWAVGPLISLDLFSGFRKVNSVDQAAAALRSARARKSELEQQIFVQLKQAQAQLEDAKRRMELTEQVVGQAQDNLELVTELYRIGRASAVDLTDAETSLSNARAQEVQARFDYLAAVAQIQHITGGNEP
ncbi:MAG TPA: TolC family protein [bacterium]|nr:TolC family protein [bacterium]